MRTTMRNAMLGMTLVAGLLGSGAAVANAAPRGFEGRADHGYGRPVDRNFGGHNFVRRDPVRPGYGYGGGYGYRGGFGVAVGGPVYGGPVVDAYIPPSPGDGYEWGAGYYNGGVWIPGAWRLRAGYRGGFAYAHGFDRGRGFDRGFHGRR
jgi:hypothetical protein